MKSEKFIIEYCRILDLCHGQRPDLLWFSTWMASKSPYFNFAQNFEEIWKTGQLPPKTNKLRKVLLLARLSLTLFTISFRTLALKWIFRRELRLLFARPNKDLQIVRTFAYTPDAQQRDPFWGELIAKLSVEKTPLLVIYEPQFSIWNCRQFYNSKYMNLPHYVFISLQKLWSFFFIILTEAFSELRFNSDLKVSLENNKNLDLKDFVITEYQVELLRPSTLSNLSFFVVFSSALEQFKVKKIFIPFENNPWEKMIHLAAISYGNATQIIGFQHSSIPEGAINYFLSRYEVHNKLAPKIIFTVGKLTANLLKSFPHYHSLDVREGCALRYSEITKFNDQNSISKSKLESQILVVLDGTLDAVFLLKLVSIFLEKNTNKNITMRIRPHPNMPLTKLTKGMKKQNINFDNQSLVEIDSYDLEKSLKWADVILYSGSTIGFEALTQGKCLINYNFRLFNYDPLFQFNALKWTVRSPQELSDALAQIALLSESELQFKRQKAKDFVLQYFSTCTNDTIARFLQQNES